jgi:phenylalanyl-tRNA synthetase beta chain
VALAGVMGGRDSEVSDSTVNVLLESARFDPLSVRTTARRLAMKSDSSYRFERGIDPTLPLRASLRAAQLIVETAGGELLAGVAQAGAELAPTRSLSLRISRLNQLLGIDVDPQTAVDSLARLQLNPVLSDSLIAVTVPSWRADLRIEADLIEEVARVIGYDKIPIRDQIQIQVLPPQPEHKTIDRIRSTLVAGGYFEAITVTFVSDQLADDFKPQSVSLPRTEEMVRKADGRLRPSLLPGLLEAIRRNENAGTLNARLFEIGSTFVLSAGKVDERRKLAFVGGELREVRGMVETLLSRLDASRAVLITASDQPGLASGASGRIEWGGKAVGNLGRIAPIIAAKLDLRESPAAAELELSELLAGTQHVPQLRPLPRFPSVTRDLSFVVPDAFRFETLGKLIKQVNPQHLEDVQYIGSYRGKQLHPNQKSLTISLVFRSPGDTLTSEAVDGQVRQVVDAAALAGISLRK